MSLPTPAILLAMSALILVGCDKPAILPATAADNASASAVRPDLMMAGTPEYIRQKTDETRGALLYSTYCNACHTSKIYWRKKRLVTDMNSLRFQVRRWQSNIGLNWTEEEIADAVRYLNAAYYGFPEAGQKGSLGGEKPHQTQRNN